MSAPLLAGQTLAGICPSLPPGMQSYSDQITSWAKGGVLGLLGLSVFVSLGALLVGRIFHHPQGARYGAIGLAVSLMVAVLFVTLYAIVVGIADAGC
jgi:hypothetical protein